MSNLPKLSKRAQQALELFANGGMLGEILERNSYTGREQFQTRFFTANHGQVRGLGVKTKFELENAGFHFSLAHSTSVSSYYKLSHAG